MPCVWQCLVPVSCSVIPLLLLISLHSFCLDRISLRLPTLQTVPGVTLPPLVDEGLLRKAETGGKKAESESFHMSQKPARFPIYLEILLTRSSTNCLIGSAWKLRLALGKAPQAQAGSTSGWSHLPSLHCTSPQVATLTSTSCLLTLAAGGHLQHTQNPHYRTECIAPGFAAVPIQLCRVPQGTPQPQVCPCGAGASYKLRWTTKA